MTTKENLETLELIKVRHGNGNPRYMEALQVAQEAVEHTQPVKAVHIGGGKFGGYACPVCGTAFLRDDPYCSKCGARMEWE